MTPSQSKRCPRCCAPGVKLPLDAFPPCRSRGDGRQSYCRACYRAAQREYHRRNGDKRRAHVRRITAAARARNHAQLLVYLAEHPCTDCGNADVRVLEFHHVSGKMRDVSSLVRQGCGWARVTAEIARCIVLCANCHRIREAERRGYFRSEGRRGGVVREPRDRYPYSFGLRLYRANSTFPTPSRA